MLQRGVLRGGAGRVEGLAVERGDRVFFDRDPHRVRCGVHARGRKVRVVHARAPGGGLEEAQAFERGQVEHGDGPEPVGKT